MIKLRWYGQSMWRIWTDAVSIVCDPFGDVGFDIPPKMHADIVLISHDHFDHCNISLIANKDAQIIRTAGKYSTVGIEIELLQVWHDASQGKERGINHLMKFKLEGKTFLHCGDWGHLPDEKTLSAIGKIDALLIPIGGRYTIDAKQAHQICQLLKPVLVLPMHYKVGKATSGIADLSEFVSLSDNVQEVDSCEMELSPEIWQSTKTLILGYE